METNENKRGRKPRMSGCGVIAGVAEIAGNQESCKRADQCKCKRMEPVVILGKPHQGVR